MAEIYLNGTELSKVDKLCLKDFFDKVEKTPDVELLDTLAYIATEDDEKLFTVWITVNDVPCSCSIITSTEGKCRMYIVYINGKTMCKVNMEYCGNAGYTAGTFLLRTKLWALKNKNILTIKKFPSVNNDRKHTGEEKTVI